MKIKFKFSHVLFILCIFLTVIIVFQHSHYINEIRKIEEKRKDTDLPISSQKKIIDFITANIEQIVNEEHMSGGKWFLTKIEFLNKGFVLVYYEDGHDAGHLILKIKKVDNPVEYDIY